jgi:hypothetical protein
MPQSFVSLPVHLVFSTKNRAALIGDDMQSRLHEYIGGILREQKSESNLPQVTRYIANQTQHHHAQSYQDEFIALLKKHEIEFDERYLWE